MKKRLLFILLLFIAWLPVFVIQKPVFMFYQHALAGDCSFVDYLLVMLHGTKLDCTIAGYLTAVPLLLTLVSTWLPGDWLKKVLKGYYLFTGLLVAAIFAVDVALYGFWGFRMDATLFFYLRSPADAMASAFKVPAKRYWRMKVRALADSENWDLLTVLGEKKSPIGYAPFVEACMVNHNAREAAAFLEKMLQEVE